MVFQSYALYPHMSVRQNLGYGLKVRRTPKAEIRKRVDEIAVLLGLDELLERRPAQLSGGQRQRVAMGRAIVRQPQAFLMDEPLSNLDAKLRVGMRASLAQLHQQLGVTTVYVTHDQVEAMTLGQRVAVMRDGRILQVDTPQTLYEQPARPLRRGLHRLAGDEPRRGDGRRRRRRVRAVPRSARSERDAPSLDGGPCHPRHPPGDASRTPPSRRPTFRRSTSRSSCSRSSAPTRTCSSASTRRASPSRRSRARRTTAADLVTDRGSLLNARVDPRTTARVGGSLRLAVDPARFHFFDPDTGRRSLLPTRRRRSSRTAPVAR